MISTENIKKSFGQVDVLKGINISIDKGELVSIVGASGAGKTTLLQILGTLLNPDEGKVIINSTDVFKLKNKAIAKFRNQELGFVFQFHQLLPEFNAFENAILPAMLGKVNPKEYKHRAHELFDFLNISHRLTHKPNELSGGEQQRVAVARALINQPSVLFADEPTGNLDSNNTQELFDLLLKLKIELNQTVVLVTHNENLAEKSDRILRMKDGLIVS
ncbi:MAG: ABC transporter ATP-binding protein [Bacteroidales bacterium]|nr:ABC transporter ATP-binding protein [Bacteroidales bacterium]